MAIGTATSGIEMNAEAVIGLFSFLDPTQKKQRIFTTEDLVKESEKIRGQARVQMSQNRETDALVDEQRGSSEKLLGKGNVVSSATPIEAGSLRAHNFAPVFLR